MKNMTSKSVLLIAVVLLQACAAVGGRGGQKNDLRPDSTSNVEQGIAKDIGRLRVGESLISNLSNDTSVREYSVFEVYTAASGRVCREVGIKVLHEGSTVETAVLCQKNVGDWYWPRDVIFQ